MSERYSYFQRLRGQPKRIKTRVSREVYILSRQQKTEAGNNQAVWDPCQRSRPSDRNRISDTSIKPRFALLDLAAR